MSLSERIRRHLQSHVVGYLALFVALSGTALALPGQKTVKSDDLANGAVKGKAIAGNAVSTAKVRDGAITGPKLGGSAVTTSALADGSVTTTKLADDAVIRQKIAQGEINGGKLANGAVNSSKVADGTLLAEDFGAGQISDGFAFTNEPDFSGGTVINFATTSYNAPRSGRLLLTATMTTNVNCGGPCDLEVALFIDGTYVPGSTRVAGEGVLAATSGSTAVTTSALVAVAAGAHTIEIRGVNDGTDSLSLSNEAITGVLLQG